MCPQHWGTTTIFSRYHQPTFPSPMWIFKLLSPVQYFIGKKYGDNLLHNLKKEKLKPPVPYQWCEVPVRLPLWSSWWWGPRSPWWRPPALPGIRPPGSHRNGRHWHPGQPCEGPRDSGWPDMSIMFANKILTLINRIWSPSSQDPGLLAWPLEQSPSPWLLVWKCPGIRPSHLSSPS